MTTRRVTLTRQLMLALAGWMLALVGAAAADVGSSAATPHGGSASADRAASAGAARSATALRGAPHISVSPPVRRGAVGHPAQPRQPVAATRPAGAKRTIAPLTAMARAAIVGGPHTKQRGTLGGAAASGGAAHGALSGSTLRRRF